MAKHAAGLSETHPLLAQVALHTKRRCQPMLSLDHRSHALSPRDCQPAARRRLRHRHHDRRPTRLQGAPHAGAVRLDVSLEKSEEANAATRARGGERAKACAPTRRPCSRERTL